MDNTSQTKPSLPEHTAPQPTPSSKTIKLVLVVVVVLGIVFSIPFLVLAYYQNRFNEDMKIVEQNEKLLQPTQVLDETANWKTYRDNKFNFEIKYPGQWSAGDFSDCTAGFYAIYITSATSKLNLCQVDLTILVSQTSSQSCFPAKSSNELSRIDLMIANQPAQQLVIKNPRGTGRDETIVGFGNKNNCYTITNREQIVPGNIFNQILATFQFN